jgi:predicted  nucleic acid-binding Zn-ribbon protein
MNASVDPLSHALGRIENALETITKTLSEDRAASAQYRTDMRRDLSTVRENVLDLKNRVSNNADELAEMRPDVDDYRRRRDKGIGMADLTKVVWTTLLGFGAVGIGAIVHAFWPAAK